jgi:hypothetical protein
MGGLVLAAAERLPEQPLGPAALHGRSHLPAGRQAQATVSPAVLEGDDHQQGSVDPEALAENPAHVGGRVDPFAGPQGLPAAPQRRPARRRRACAPSDAAASGPAVLPWFSCEPGTHASSFACDCSAGKSASCWLPLGPAGAPDGSPPFQTTSKPSAGPVGLSNRGGAADRRMPCLPEWSRATFARAGVVRPRPPPDFLVSRFSTGVEISVQKTPRVPGWWGNQGPIVGKSFFLLYLLPSLS